MDLRSFLEKNRELAGFLIVGGINTLVTWAIYVLLNRLMSYELAFSATYVVGISLSYYMNSRWVFRVPLSWKTFLQYPVVYAVQYGVGLVLLYLLVELAHVPEDLAPIVITAITVPITFVISRFILKAKPVVAPPRVPGTDA